MTEVGTVIIVLMKQRNLKQYELAKKAGIGHGTVSSIVGGRSRLTVPVAHKIARALKVVSAKDLLLIQLQNDLDAYDNTTKKESSHLY